MRRAKCFDHDVTPVWKRYLTGWQLKCPSPKCIHITGIHPDKKTAEIEWNVNYGNGNQVKKEN